MAQKTGAFCKKTLEGSRDNRVEARRLTSGSVGLTVGLASPT
jgi:hypothetical protein